MSQPALTYRAARVQAEAHHLHRPVGGGVTEITAATSALRKCSDREPSNGPDTGNRLRKKHQNTRCQTTIMPIVSQSMGF